MFLQVSFSFVSSIIGIFDMHRVKIVNFYDVFLGVRYVNRDCVPKQKKMLKFVSVSKPNVLNRECGPHDTRITN